METGILVCGLNGAGKSTFGKALAEKLKFHFIDNEDLYFPKTDKNYLFANPRTREEAKSLLLHDIVHYKNFVFSSVKGDYGTEVYSLFQYAILIEVPKDIRMQRVKNRSYEKFGDRMDPGGDLYEREKSFFDMVKNRKENTVEEWIQCLKCPIIRIDGTKSIEENIEFVLREMK